jgi:hypothetical protein
MQNYRIILHILYLDMKRGYIDGRIIQDDQLKNLKKKSKIDILTKN